MKTRTWIILFAAVLVLCLASGFYLLSPGEASDSAQIVSNGQIIKTVNLRIDQNFIVETENGGFNVITVSDGKIGVTEASCPDHYCMARGFCNSGAQIVCLPNRLVIEFLEETEIDGIVG